MENYLRRLSDIPWEQRRTASGFACDVPYAIRELASPDEAVRRRAYWRLDNHIVVQSDLFEAAYDVVPILVAMLEERIKYGRDLAYDLLYELGNGYAPDDVTCRRRDGATVGLREGCRSEVKAGIHVYERDLRDPDPKIRSNASDLIELIAGNDHG